MNKITVTTNKKASMSDFYGIFFEDINHAADGGLYGEMIRNRAFEFSPMDNPSYQALLKRAVRRYRHLYQTNHRFQSEIQIILFLKLTKQAQEPA